MTDTYEKFATERLAALESEVAILKEQLGRRKAPKPPPVDEGVRISELRPEVSCELPSPDQLRELANIVFREFPKLAPSYPHCAPQWRRDDIERRWHKGFEAAFLALAAMRRLDQPDHRHYAHHFVDHAESWLRSYGISADVGEPFFPACLAFGDIPWVDPRIDGQVLALGLNGYTGRLASAESWQRVLRTGELLPPTARRALSMAPRAPSRVIIGARY